MLYRKICLGFALLTTHTLAGNYYFSAKAGDTSCTNATPNDTCHFYCDVTEWKQNFNCGQAKECNIYCSHEKCFESATISASNVVNDLNVYASGEEKECYKSTNFNLPNYGNATFSITGSGNNPFKEMTVNSGTNTNEIVIDCDGDDNKDYCKQITVNAQTAQYLEINIGDATLNGDSKTDDPAIINCPQNSNYNGPNSAPCYIKATNGGTIELVTINTLYGIPMDVWIDGNNYKDVTITAANSGCTDQTSVGFTQQSPCWYTTTTGAPTTSTATPTTTTTTTTSTSTTTPTTTTVRPTSTTAEPSTSLRSTSISSTTQLSTTYAITTQINSDSPTTSVSDTTKSLYLSTTSTVSSQTTVAVTEHYRSTLSNVFSSTISSTLAMGIAVAETLTETDYFIINGMGSNSESNGFNASVIVAIVLSFIAIVGCLCCIVFMYEYNKDSHEEAPADNNKNRQNKMENNQYKREEKGKDMEVNHLPSLCMVVTQSASMDMNMVNTAGSYGENGTGNTPIEIEIEGNIPNMNPNNKLNVYTQSNDDIEVIFGDDEVIGDDIEVLETVNEVIGDDIGVLEMVNNMQETPMGPVHNNVQYSDNDMDVLEAVDNDMDVLEAVDNINFKATPMGPINNVQYSDNEAIEIALHNFTTKQ